MLATTDETAETPRRKRGGTLSKTRDGRLKLPSIEDLDGRTLAARRFRELVASYSSDLGGDLTTAQSAIIQRAVSVQLWCESIEAQYIATGAMDIQTYGPATNALRRLLADIGMERRSRDVTPDLSTYVKGRE